MKKILFPTVLFVSILVFSFFVLLKNQPINQKYNQSQIILFYGIGCPLCEKVEEFIKENQIEKKIPFAKKEVYFNRQNARELQEKAKICKIPESELGVPFLWDGEKCFLGYFEIIDFFKEKIEK
jgi:glutaredoxin